MMQQEFEKIMKISGDGEKLKLHPQIYKVIEAEYMESAEDKVAFCQRVEDEQLIIKAAGQVIESQAAQIQLAKKQRGESEHAYEKALQGIEREEKVIRDLQDELDKAREIQEKKKDREEDLEAEIHCLREQIIHLKAKLYDLTVKE